MDIKYRIEKHCAVDLDTQDLAEGFLECYTVDDVAEHLDEFIKDEVADKIGDDYYDCETDEEDLENLFDEVKAIILEIA